MKRHKPKFDPSLPLRHPRHESVARQLLLLKTPLDAMNAASPPYDKPTARNASRLAHHPKIVARIKYLATCDNDIGMVQLRRARIRDVLERIMLADRTKLFEEVDVPERNEDGSIVVVDGKPLMRSIRRLRSFDEMSDDERLLIEGVEFDGEKEKVKTVERLPAIAQLRKLDSLDRPEKVAFTDPDGNGLPVLPSIVMTGKPEELETESA